MHQLVLQKADRPPGDVHLERFVYDDGTSPGDGEVNDDPITRFLAFIQQNSLPATTEDRGVPVAGDLPSSLAEVDRASLELLLRRFASNIIEDIENATVMESRTIARATSSHRMATADDSSSNDSRGTAFESTMDDVTGTIGSSRFGSVDRSNASRLLSRFSSKLVKEIQHSTLAESEALLCGPSLQWLAKYDDSASFLSGENMSRTKKSIRFLPPPDSQEESKEADAKTVIVDRNNIARLLSRFAAKIVEDIKNATLAESKAVLCGSTWLSLAEDDLIRPAFDEVATLDSSGGTGPSTELCVDRTTVVEMFSQFATKIVENIQHATLVESEAIVRGVSIPCISKAADSTTSFSGESSEQAALLGYVPRPICYDASTMNHVKGMVADAGIAVLERINADPRVAQIASKIDDIQNAALNESQAILCGTSFQCDDSASFYSGCTSYHRQKPRANGMPHPRKRPPKRPSILFESVDDSTVGSDERYANTLDRMLGVFDGTPIDVFLAGTEFNEAESVDDETAADSILTDENVVLESMIARSLVAFHPDDGSCDDARRDPPPRPQQKCSPRGVRLADRLAATMKPVEALMPVEPVKPVEPATPVANVPSENVTVYFRAKERIADQRDPTFDSQDKPVPTLETATTRDDEPVESASTSPSKIGLSRSHSTQSTPAGAATCSSSSVSSTPVIRARSIGNRLGLRAGRAGSLRARPTARTPPRRDRKGYI
jgi:hypothetical protein